MAGPVIDAVAGDLVALGRTSSLFDTVYGSNVTAGGTSDNGQLPTGLYVAAGAQANVVGGGNGISVGQSGILGAYGNGNQIAAQAYAGIVVSGNNNSVSTTSGGLATFSGIGNSAAVNNTDVFLLDGNAVAISGTPANAAAVQAALATSPQTASGDGKYKGTFTDCVDKSRIELSMVEVDHSFFVFVAVHPSFLPWFSGRFEKQNGRLRFVLAPGW